MAVYVACTHTVPVPWECRRKENNTQVDWYDLNDVVLQDRERVTSLELVDADATSCQIFLNGHERTGLARVHTLVLEDRAPLTHGVVMQLLTARTYAEYNPTSPSRCYHRALHMMGIDKVKLKVTGAACVKGFVTVRIRTLVGPPL